MLNSKERKVMSFLYYKCKDRESCLIAPQEIVNHLMPKFEANLIEVDQIINSLVLDGYIDVVHSDSKGKLIYVISLKPKGAAYERENKHRKQRTYMIIARTIILACLSFLVGIILTAIFK